MGDVPTSSHITLAMGVSPLLLSVGSAGDVSKEHMETPIESPSVRAVHGGFPIALMSVSQKESVFVLTSSSPTTC